jgi:hypothetical protein
MPPPLLSRRATAAACGEGAARATAAEGDIERRNEAAVVARVVASARARCSALGRSRSVVWPLPALVPANRRGRKSVFAGRALIETAGAHFSPTGRPFVAEKTARDLGLGR